MTTLKELMKEIKSPEYKQEQIDKNQKTLSREFVIKNRQYEVF